MAFKGKFADDSQYVDAFVWEGMQDEEALKKFLTGTHYEIKSMSKLSAVIRNIVTSNEERVYANGTWLLKAGRYVMLYDGIWSSNHEQLKQVQGTNVWHMLRHQDSAFETTEPDGFIKETAVNDSMKIEGTAYDEANWQNFSAVILSKRRWKAYAAKHGIALDPDDESWKAKRTSIDPDMKG